MKISFVCDNCIWLLSNWPQRPVNVPCNFVFYDHKLSNICADSNNSVRVQRSSKHKCWQTGFTFVSRWKSKNAINSSPFLRASWIKYPKSIALVSRSNKQILRTDLINFLELWCRWLAWNIHDVCALNGEYSSWNWVFQRGAERLENIPLDIFIDEPACRVWSRKRGSRYPKLSKWQARLPWGMEWSKPDCGICTDEQELHTEAIRSDEVSHAAEVQPLETG